MRLMNLFPQAKRTGRILVLGELLLDFIPTQSGMRLCEPGTVVKTVSGSAGIFACAAAALGAQCGFVGRVGKDPFSRLAVQTVAQAGVDTSPPAAGSVPGTLTRRPSPRPRSSTCRGCCWS